MLEFEETEWSVEKRARAKEFFESPAGKAFLTDINTAYTGRMKSLVTMDFKAPNAMLMAVEVQSEARAYFALLGKITELMEAKDG